MTVLSSQLMRVKRCSAGARSSSYCHVTPTEMKRWLLAEKLPSVHRRGDEKMHDASLEAY